ncbi:hypothetical protein CFN78_06200 [Amycolatopsis antarctica]|uniref:DUF4352 domain-containing protein n=1 Tax=Amycolatopsis antarctica TaxID=1854586 RepID=A0A263D9X6_9PSEU|nr:hypothetical protein CFN78_06200 [Amycolatopsis antarctica]
MRTPGRILAAGALLVLTACGATEASEGPTPGIAGRPVAGAAPAGSTADPTGLTFGSEYRFASGLTVRISTPKSFRPSDTAYPRSDRAVAVEVSLYNEGARSFRLSNLTAVARIDGAPAKQVVDPTQGFNGVVNADTDLPQGRNVRLMLAFAVPARPAELTLSVQPDGAVPVVASYRGEA